jgi:hypothetical protein
MGKSPAAARTVNMTGRHSNHASAERENRPVVILRKSEIRRGVNSQCNRSEGGAATQAVLKSIMRTLELRVPR